MTIVFMLRNHTVILDKPRSGVAPGSILERRNPTMDPGTSLREAQDDATFHAQTHSGQSQ
jgi:hypothetical protein